MKVTKDTVKAARAAIKIPGRRISFEYAICSSVSDGYYTGNALLWRPDSDILETDTFTPGTQFAADESRAGLVLVDMYVYHSQGKEMSLSGNVWFLFASDGRFLAHDNDRERIARKVAIHAAEELGRKLQREEWAIVAEKWRKLAGMPLKRRGSAPLDIVADWAEDHDDATGAAMLRQAHAAGFKG